MLGIFFSWMAKKMNMYLTYYNITKGLTKKSSWNCIIMPIASGSLISDASKIEMWPNLIMTFWYFMFFIRECGFRFFFLFLFFWWSPFHRNVIFTAPKGIHWIWSYKWFQTGFYSLNFGPLNKKSINLVWFFTEK